MKSCPYCSAAIPDAALGCPKCGRDLINPTNTATYTNEPKRRVASVRVVDFDMPFWSVVVLMVKWSLAAIPALLILFFVSAVLIGMLAALGLSF